MIPKELRITNFRSFGKTQTFYFPGRPGFYFLTGNNLSESRLESNGAGKSSIWDALCWVLFGRTPKGLKAGDVANWDVGKSTQVELLYEVDGADWIVSRTWGPISWTLYGPDGTAYALVPDDPSNLLCHHLGTDYTPFLHTCLIAQGEDMFLDLKPPQKEALVADVLSFDQWLGYSDKASQLASALDFQITIKRGNLHGLRGQLEENNSYNFTNDSEQWEKVCQEDIAKLNAEHKEKAATANGLRNMRGGILRGQESLTIRIRTAKFLAETKRSDLALLRKTNDQHEDHIRDMETDLNAANKQKENLAVDRCPSCLQTISEEYRLRQNTALAQRAASLVSGIKIANEAASREQRKEQDIDHVIQEIAEDITRLEEQYRKGERELHQLDSDVTRLNAELDDLEEEATELLNKPNPFQVRKAQQEGRRQELEEEIQSLSNRIDEDTAELRCLQYWVRGFKEIRLYLIAEATVQLELEVNSSLTQLGLMDWRLLFDVDRENKSGKIQKGFNVKVLSPHNKEPVPWESWSGGESQRLRIAAEMGLANLIRSARGIDFALEVWDEPTQWLSAQGVSDLLNSLAIRARDNNRQVWIVDHRSLGYGDFDGTVTVIKDGSGSQIVG